MSYVIVNNQRELDQAQSRWQPVKVVRGFYTVLKGVIVVAGCAVVNAHNDTKVYASEHARVVAFDECKITASGRSHITAYDVVRVLALEECIVTAFNTTKIAAFQSSLTLAYDDTNVLAHDKSMAFLSNRAIGTAYQSAAVVNADKFY